MRASATSRISHQASLQASHAATHAAQADEASPFALLVHAAARKDSQGSDDKSDDAQPGNASAKTDDSGKSNISPAQPAADNKTTDQTATAKADPAGKTDKSDKTGKADTQASADQTATAVQPPQAILPQLVVAQAAMAQPNPQMTAAAPANYQDADDAAPVSSLTAPGKGAGPTQSGAAQSAAPQATDPLDGQTAQAGVQPAMPGVQNGKPAAATDKSAKTDSRDTASASDAKTSDDTQAAPQPTATADAPKASQAPSPNLTIAGIAPTQQGSTPAAPLLTQHVQVTAQPPANQPMPNLPALGVEIAARSQSGARQFDIRLDPPELGRVEVRLSIDATGKASAHLSADQPQTLDLLQKDATGLARALRDAGLNVSQDGLNFSLRQQAGQDNGGGSLPRRGGALSLHASKSIEATATSAIWRAPANGRLDISV